MTTSTPPSIAVFGEVLMDQFPDGQLILGGAPFNVAWHLQAFGLNPQFISRVGADPLGASIRQAMLGWGMTVGQLQTDTVHPTGVVAVSLVEDEPHYEILPGQAYDFIEADALPADSYSVLYHGTLALRQPTSEQAVNALLARHQGKVFVDVNLRAPWWHKAAVLQWLHHADWVKLNQEELLLLSPPHDSLPAAMAAFLQTYDLAVLVVTCGSEGAMALTAAGAWVKVAPAENTPLVDSVGAGDAFAAVLLLGLLRDWPLAYTMARAQDFASAMVGQRGATVSEAGFYQAFVQAWPLR